MPVPYWIDSNTTYSDALSFINDNFQKIPTTPKEMGIRYTTTATFDTGSIASGGTFYKVISILNPSETLGTTYVNTEKTVSAISVVTPLIDVYVDNNNDPNYLFPLGSGMTAGQQSVVISHYASYTNVSGSKISFIINGRNNDSGAHTYYFKVKVGYIPY